MAVNRDRAALGDSQPASSVVDPPRRQDRAESWIRCVSCEICFFAIVTILLESVFDSDIPHSVLRDVPAPEDPFVAIQEDKVLEDQGARGFARMVFDPFEFLLLRLEGLRATEASIASQGHPVENNRFDTVPSGCLSPAGKV